MDEDKMSRVDEQGLVVGLLNCHGNSNTDECSETMIELLRLAQEQPEVAWRIILSVIKQNPPQDVLGLLSAGPLEDLVQFHGSQFIDRIEDQAVRNPSFAQLVRGVYRGDLDSETWNRIVTLSGRKPETRN